MVWSCNNFVNVNYRSNFYSLSSHRDFHLKGVVSWSVIVINPFLPLRTNTSKHAYQNKKFMTNPMSTPRHRDVEMTSFRWHSRDCHVDSTWCAHWDVISNFLCPFISGVTASQCTPSYTLGASFGEFVNKIVHILTFFISKVSKLQCWYLGK